MRTSLPALSGPHRGLALAVTTHLLWGVFPLYFAALAPAGAFEVICHRAVWSLACALLLLLATGHVGQLRALVRDHAVMWRMTIAAVLIVANWTTYVYAVQTGRTIDASLGYFINPLFTVALGRIVLHERLRRAQAVALCFAAVAIVIMATGLSSFPWLALVMPATFAFYSLVKKNVAPRVPAIAGMTIETAVAAPFLGIYLLVLAARGDTSIQEVAAQAGSGPAALHAALLVTSGLVTLVPLLCLAAAAKTLPLSVLGLLQYLSPTIQLIIATCVFGEYVEPARWVASAFVWAALVLLIVDGIASLRARRGR